MNHMHEFPLECSKLMRLINTMEKEGNAPFSLSFSLSTRAPGAGQGGGIDRFSEGTASFFAHPSPARFPSPSRSAQLVAQCKGSELLLVSVPAKR